MAPWFWALTGRAVVYFLDEDYVQRNRFSGGDDRVEMSSKCSSSYVNDTTCIYIYLGHNVVFLRLKCQCHISDISKQWDLGLDEITYADNAEKEE